MDVCVMCFAVRTKGETRDDEDKETSTDDVQSTRE